MPENLENSAVGTRTGKGQFSFLSQNAKECSNYSTIALISHVSQVILKILQARLQQYVNQELPDVQVGFRKGEEPEVKLPTYTGSQKNQENSRKTATSASLTVLKPLIHCVDQDRQWKILKAMGIPDHPTCLLVIK